MARWQSISYLHDLYAVQRKVAKASNDFGAQKCVARGARCVVVGGWSDFVGSVLCFMYGQVLRT